MIIAITGSTGLLGRNLVMEIIKKNLNALNNLKILIFGKSRKEHSLKERIENIIYYTDHDYLNLAEDYPIDELKNFVDNYISYINLDLNSDDLNISHSDMQLLKKIEIDVFFHIASLTDFRNFKKIKQNLWNTNVYGTERILNLITQLKIKRFCYVSSAYVCGLETGDIKPDFIKFSQKFRNPYELSKLEAEVKVREYYSKFKINTNIFRASTICGRLIEKELGKINKFDVFYSWAAFFFRLKIKYFKLSQSNLYDPVKMDSRILYSKDSGLNIVPVDYAAKVMYIISQSENADQCYHLTNYSETKHDIYIPAMLKNLNINGVVHTDSVPEDKNKLERFYYDTVGSIFTPYITCNEMKFDTNNLQFFHDKYKLKCPEVDKRNFNILLEYAKKKNYGLEI